MLLNRWILSILALFSLFIAHTAHADTIGTIVEIEGTVTVAQQGKPAAPAKLQQEISELDTIATGPNSRAFILLIDDTEWTLSENTRFQVSDYAFNPDNSDDNKARYNVIEGAFRYVSGLVAKRPNPDVEISTPVGSIGIRGTDFSAGPQDDGQYGVYVDEGSVNVKNDGGAELLKQGQGTYVRGRGTAPSHAAVWRKDRLERLRGRVQLKNPEQIRSRMQAMRGHQMELREKFKQNFQQKREQRKQQFQQKMDERKGENQERKTERGQKIEQLKQNRQEKVEQRQEGQKAQLQNFQQKKEERQQNIQAQQQQWQEKKQEAQGDRQEKIQQFQQNQQQRQQQVQGNEETLKEKRAERLKNLKARRGRLQQQDGDAADAPATEQPAQ